MGHLREFIRERLKVQQREAGVRHDLIDAVFALGGEDDLVRLLARVKALQAFVATEDGVSLLALYKRAAPMLRGEGRKYALGPSIYFTYVPEPAEAALADALQKVIPLASIASEREDFEDAMKALATIRPLIDRFFDEITVNCPEYDKRLSRYGLLEKLRVAVHNVADFSRIEG